MLPHMQNTETTNLGMLILVCKEHCENRVYLYFISNWVTQGIISPSETFKGR